MCMCVHLSGVFYIPNLNSLVPTSTWLWEQIVPTRSEARVGYIERCLEDASGWAGFQLEYQECLAALASAPSRTAAPSRGHTAQGLTAYLTSTPLELSKDVNVVILVKTSENTLQYRKPPYKFTYPHMSRTCT